MPIIILDGWNRPAAPPVYRHHCPAAVDEYALRTFQRAPLVAFTIVSTVALGLGLVAVAFTMLNAMLFRADAVPAVHEMFAVRRPPTADGERQRFTRAQFDALRRDTAVFADVYAGVSDVDSRVDGRVMFGTFVTGNFFHVRHRQLLSGGPRRRRDGAHPDACRRRATGNGPQ